MAAVVMNQSLLACLTTSAVDPLCERINKVAWSSIWPFALAIGGGLGGLITWEWVFNPLIAIPIAVGIALFVSAVYFLFQWPLAYKIDSKYDDVLKDTVTTELLCDPRISLRCGHTAEEQSAFGFINVMGKCTVSCEQKLTKQDLVPNRLIIGLLNALHKKTRKEADVAFRAFVERHKDESMVLPDGRSCNLLKKVLLMRAQQSSKTWAAFCEQHQKDLFRGKTQKKFRVGVDVKELQEALLGNKKENLDQKLEDLYKQSTYNFLWQRVVDKYMQQMEQSGEYVCQIATS